VHQPHAEHVAVEIDRHLHVVGIERQMMDAVEGDPVVGARLDAIGE